MSDGCSCQLVYDVIECHVRALGANGNYHPSTDWVMSDSIIDFDISPEIEAGAKKPIRCGGRLKNTMQEADELTGATVKVSFCCQNAEVEYIINGSVGTVTYDASSPPCAIAYQEPTPAEQADAVPFEMRLYLREIEGSNTVGYKEIHFYQCLPTFMSESGNQQEYATPEYTIKCTDNPNYSADEMPVRSWRMINTIPT